MFQKKNIDMLIAERGLDFKGYSIDTLDSLNKQDLRSAVERESIFSKAVTITGLFSFAHASLKQSWIVVRQNELLSRQNEQIINQNAGIAHQNQKIIELLQNNPSD